MKDHSGNKKKAEQKITKTLHFRKGKIQKPNTILKSPPK